MAFKVYDPSSKSFVQKDVTWISTVDRHTNQVVRRPTIQRQVSKPSFHMGPALKTWITFCDQSTIHGLRFACGTGPRYALTRLLWGLLFLGMCGLCLWLCLDSANKYLQYRVKTTTYFDTNNEVVFPAITFNNENLFLKRVVGSSRGFIEGVTTFVVNSFDEFQHFLPHIIEVCYDPSVRNNLTDDLDSGYGFWLKYGMSDGMRLTTPDSYYSAVNCWFLDEEVDCSGLFLNHASDFGWSFTFNPGYTVVEESAETSGSSYGLDTERYTLRTVDYVGSKNGLQLLLNVGQEDYCIVRRDFSAGFRIVVHDPDIQPLFFMSTPFLVAPGFYTNVAIKMTRINRYTDHLNKCVKFQHLSFYPHATKYYKEQCYLDCFTRFVFDLCGCVPFYGPFNASELILTFKGIKSNSSAPVCFGPQLICMKSHRRKFLSSVSQNQCPSCKDPCFDKVYELEISHQHFPSSNSAPVLAKTFRVNATMEEWHENYLMINFHMESVHMVSIEENQDFTVFDLFANIGGVLGLFLGMSILSFGEVLHEIVLFTFTAFRRRNI